MYIESSDKYAEAGENLRKVLIDVGRESIEDMKPQELMFMQAVTKFIAASETVVQEQEKMLNTIDYKLDQLFKKLETK